MFRKTYLFFSFLCFTLISTNIVHVKASPVAIIVDSKTAYNSVTREILIEERENTTYNTVEEIEKNINDISGLVVIKSTENNLRADYSLLIPRDAFESTSNDIVSLGDIVYDNTFQSDLSSELLSLDADIKNKESYKNIIMKMLEDSNDLTTILELEKYLVDVEIQQSSSQNSFFSTLDLVNYGTLNITLMKNQTVVDPVIDDKNGTENSFGEKLSLAFKESFNFTGKLLENVLVVVSYIFIPSILVVLTLLIVNFVKKGGKNNGKK